MSVWDPINPATVVTPGSSPSVDTDLSPGTNPTTAELFNYTLTSYTTVLPEPNVWIPGQHKRNFVVTSALYPIKHIEKFAVNSNFAVANLYNSVVQSVNISSQFIAGTLTSVVVALPPQDIQSLTISASFIAGTLTTVVVTFPAQEVQKFAISSNFISGTLTVVVVTLPPQRIENLSISSNFIAGTLTPV